MTEAVEVDFLRLGIFLGMAVSIAIVILHASFTNKNILLWGAVSFIPILGIVIYFIIHYVQIAGDSTRRAKIHEERRWEFELTDKGKKIDPNKDDDDKEAPKTYGDGITRKVIAETPPSRIPPEE